MSLKFDTKKDGPVGAGGKKRGRGAADVKKAVKKDDKGEKDNEKKDDGKAVDDNNGNKVDKKDGDQSAVKKDD